MLCRFYELWQHCSVWSRSLGTLAADSSPVRVNATRLNWNELHECNLPRFYRPMQAHRQNIKWGEGVFCRKKWTFPPQNEMKLNQTLLCNFAGLIFYFTFYLFGGGVRTHPTYPLPTGTPPAYGHALWSSVQFSSLASRRLFCEYHRMMCMLHARVQFVGVTVTRRSGLRWGQCCLFTYQLTWVKHFIVSYTALAVISDSPRPLSLFHGLVSWNFGNLVLWSLWATRWLGG